MLQETLLFRIKANHFRMTQLSAILGASQQKGYCFIET
jgi:hypothetical protein